MSRVHFFEKSPSVRLKSDRYEFMISGYIHQSIKSDSLKLQIADQTFSPYENNLQVLVSQDLKTKTQTNQIQILDSGFIFRCNMMNHLAEKMNLRLSYEDLNGNEHNHSFNTVSLFPINQKVETGKNNAIAICMPTYNPDLMLFKKQLESIINQTYENWKLIIQDDGSSDKIYQQLEKLIDNDDRISISRNITNLGFYQNYEALFGRIGESFKYVALADQDDIWHEDKLNLCIQNLNNNKVIYSDLSIISEKENNIIASTFWDHRSNHFSDKDAICLNNTATGSTMLISQAWLDQVLPFPQKVGRVFHDHWIAFKARYHSGLGYLDKPLVKYIQHSNNETGFKPFESPKLGSRLLSNFAMVVILAKIVFKKDLTREASFISDYQEVYFLQLQRMKQFYSRAIQGGKLHQMEIKNSFILKKLLKLSFKGYFSTWYFNRYDKHIYSSILLQKALKYRSFFHKSMTL